MKIIIFVYDKKQGLKLTVVRDLLKVLQVVRSVKKDGNHCFKLNDIIIV